jgi:D-sedoheptulose 7-phosphate isomerase
MEGAISNLVQQNLGEAIAVLEAVERDFALQAALVSAAEKTASSMKRGGKLMIAGNGGSAADAQHLAAEFVNRLAAERPAMRAVALTTDTSILTSIGNDYSFERIFARQIEALGQAGEVFLAISTSGNSPNMLSALELAKRMGITTVGLTGRTGGKMRTLCDLCICIPSDVTMFIQLAHLALEHIFCSMVENAYFGQAARDAAEQA